MAWRDFYSPLDESNKALPTILQPIETVAAEKVIAQAMTSVIPPVSGEQIMEGQQTFATATLATKEGISVTVPVSAMPAPSFSDARKLCENIRKFM